ncbi:MAG TPA: hypothetical protein VL625_04610, partial [Patescibacteria group bacterium]|nr:hypothetical protein [Patescibacteria group bacterium]
MFFLLCNKCYNKFCYSMKRSAGMKNTKRKAGGAANRQSESGNVLFLILIAVALFAALSYAVTQSSRSGSGEATSEKSLISGAQITQYPAGVRTDIIRMMIDNNISVDQLEFNGPSDFGALFTSPSGKHVRSVFHPDGGGATYQLAPGDVMDSGSPGMWYYNADWFVTNIGTTPTTDSTGNEMTAFLVDIKQSVCQKIDDALGIISNPIPTLGNGAVADFEFTQGGGANTATPPNTFETFPATAGKCFDTTDCSTPGTLAGQPFGCVKTTDGKYVYYHVLLE